MVRLERWIKASHVLAAYAPKRAFIVVTCQDLARLDVKLISEDELVTQQLKLNNEVGVFSETSAYSYFWVLGGYELVRALDQRAREDSDFFPDFSQAINDLKHQFERVRVPLAKFEPAGRHRRTDDDIAVPGFNYDLGTMWRVAPDVWISRRELSDGLLNLLELMASKG